MQQCQYSFCSVSIMYLQSFCIDIFLFVIVIYLVSYFFSNDYRHIHIMSTFLQIIIKLITFPYSKYNKVRQRKPRYWMKIRSFQNQDVVTWRNVCYMYMIRFRVISHLFQFVAMLGWYIFMMRIFFKGFI